MLWRTGLGRRNEAEFSMVQQQDGGKGSGDLADHSVSQQ